eukprot:Sspe_Gene.4489::Locus_1479_Transcript_1_1_Confidence_1.000_Length_4152::g.4489::m.4489
MKASTPSPTKRGAPLPVTLTSTRPRSADNRLIPIPADTAPRTSVSVSLAHDSPLKSSFRRVSSIRGPQHRTSLFADDGRRRLEKLVRQMVSEVADQASAMHRVVDSLVSKDLSIEDGLRRKMMEAEVETLPKVPAEDTGLGDGEAPLAGTLLSVMGCLAAKVRSASRMIFVRAARESKKEGFGGILPQIWGADAILGALNSTSMRNDCPACFNSPPSATDMDLGDVVSQLVELCVHLLSYLGHSQATILGKENYALTRRVAVLQGELAKKGSSLPPSLQSETTVQKKVTEASPIQDIQSAITDLQSRIQRARDDQLRPLLTEQHTVLCSLMDRLCAEGQKDSFAVKRAKSLERTIVALNQDLVTTTSRLSRECDLKQGEMNRLLAENSKLRSRDNSNALTRVDPKQLVENKQLQADLFAATASLKEAQETIEKLQGKLAALEDLERQREQVVTFGSDVPASSQELSGVLFRGADSPPGASEVAACLNALGGDRWPHPRKEVCLPVASPLPIYRPVLQAANPWHVAWQEIWLRPVYCSADFNAKATAVLDIQERFLADVTPFVKQLAFEVFSSTPEHTPLSENGPSRVYYCPRRQAVVHMVLPQLFASSPAPVAVPDKPPDDAQPRRRSSAFVHPFPMPIQYFSHRKASRKARQSARAMQECLSGMVNFGGYTRTDLAVRQMIVPMNVSIDYLGCRFRCWAAPPLAVGAGGSGESTVVYSTVSQSGKGAAEGRKYITSSCVAEDVMREVAFWLNLQPHKAAESRGVAKYFYGPWDIRIARSADGLLTVCNAGSLMPPVVYQGDCDDEECFRMEFVQSQRSPLPMGFPKEVIPGTASFKSLTDAATDLHHNVIPRFTASLVYEYPDFQKAAERMVETDYLAIDMEFIKEKMHTAGINMRCIGIVVDQLATSETGETVLAVLLKTEMVARILKTQLWQDVVHSIHRMSQERDIDICLNALGTQLGVIFGDGPATCDYWRKVIAVVAETKYKYFSSQSRPLKLSALPKVKLFQRTCELAGLQYSNAVADELLGGSARTLDQNSRRMSRIVSLGSRDYGSLVRSRKRSEDPKPTIRITGILTVAKEPFELTSSPHPSVSSASKAALRGDHAQAVELLQNELRQRQGLPTNGATVSPRSEPCDKGEGDEALHPQVATPSLPRGALPLLKLQYRVTVPLCEREKEEERLMNIIQVIKADECAGFHHTGVRSFAFMEWVHEMGHFFTSWHCHKEALPFFRKALVLAEGPLGMAAGPLTIASVLVSLASCHSQLYDKGQAQEFLVRGISKIVSASHLLWVHRVEHLCRMVNQICEEGCFRDSQYPLVAACLEMLASIPLRTDHPVVLLMLAARATQNASEEGAVLDLLARLGET